MEASWRLRRLQPSRSSLPAPRPMHPWRGDLVPSETEGPSLPHPRHGLPLGRFPQRFPGELPRRASRPPRRLETRAPQELVPRARATVARPYALLLCAHRCPQKTTPSACDDVCAFCLSFPAPPGELQPLDSAGDPGPSPWRAPQGRQTPSRPRKHPPLPRMEMHPLEREAPPIRQAGPSLSLDQWLQAMATMKPARRAPRKMGPRQDVTMPRHRSRREAQGSRRPGKLPARSTRPLASAGAHRDVAPPVPLANPSIRAPPTAAPSAVKRTRCRRPQWKRSSLVAPKKATA